MKRGTLIVIEGGDASGKATQTSLLKERLVADGIAVEELDFPRYTDNTIGAVIKECLDGKHGDFMKLDPRLASILYATDRRESLPQIEAWLRAGSVVILDRYTSANMLHQGAKISDPAARSEVLSWIYRLEHEILGLPTPDLLLYLAVPAETRLQLLQKQQAEHERVLDVAEVDTEHQIQVDAAAEAMCTQYPNTLSIKCMDGNNLRSKAEIAAMIQKEVYAILNQ